MPAAAMDCPPSPNIPLPLELRVQILKYLLISPPSQPPIRFRLIWNSFKHICGNSPPGDYECSEHPYMHHFFILNQVSRSMRSEAQQVFYGLNRFEIQCIYSFIISNTGVPMGIVSAWMRESLGKMQDITIYAIRTPRRRQQTYLDVQDMVKSVAEMLKEGGISRRRLRVKWVDRLVLNSETMSFGEKSGIYRAIDQRARHEDRSRTAARMPNWAVHEVEFLAPLADLRGFKQVLVTGSVTNRWATYLESCIKSAPGTTISPYEPGDEIPDPRWPEEARLFLEPTSREDSVDRL